MADENLAAIIAEMRDKYTVHDCDECDFRKSCECSFGSDECKSTRKSISLAFGIEDGYFTKLLDRIEAAAEREMAKGMSKKLDENRAITGHAAAMREALKAIDGNTDLLDIAEGVAPNLHPSHSFVAVQIRKIVRAALAAPARNADRFATIGAAHKAWRATSQECDFCDWLFEKAEGTEVSP